MNTPPAKKKTVKSKPKTSTAKSTARKTANAQKASAAKATETEKNQSRSPADNGVLPGLMQGLQSVFDKIHKDNKTREDHQEKVIEEFSDRLTQAFQQTHAEAEEREKLLHERLEAIEREQQYKIQRIKLFSLPGTLIAVAALIYLFYVVHVMERSMTYMSADMHRIQNTIASISQDTRTMSGGVIQMNDHMQQMNGNMNHLNRNVGVMTQDVGNMSHTVSPVMNGMRNFLPF
ncbi:MAG: hypothetical protein ABW068_04415 [Candidatus Thiodiazotropha sp.]